jgi:prephenate dehydrogenase
VTTDAQRAAAAAALPGRIAFLGLGLIGGSIVLALRDAGYQGAIAAWTPDGHGPGEALRRGSIDVAARTPEEALREADLVVLAGPPLAVLSSIASLAGPWRESLSPGVTITDVASTKALIVAAATTTGAGLPFVGGHPMAGRETTGVEAASADLFVGRPWVIDPGDAAEAHVRIVVALAQAAGAVTSRLSSAEHDAVVASISHVPLVVSAALAEAIAVAPGGAASWPMARLLAASGWRDMTRLAKGDPEMGAGILATNPAAVAAGLRAVRDALDSWIADLERGPDSDAIRRRLERVKAELEVVP